MSLLSSYMVVDMSAHPVEVVAREQERIRLTSWRQIELRHPDLWFDGRWQDRVKGVHYDIARVTVAPDNRFYIKGTYVRLGGVLGRLITITRGNEFVLELYR